MLLIFYTKYVRTKEVMRSKRTHVAQVFHTAAYKTVASGWLHQNYLTELVKNRFQSNTPVLLSQNLLRLFYTNLEGNFYAHSGLTTIQVHVLWDIKITPARRNTILTY